MIPPLAAALAAAALASSAATGVMAQEFPSRPIRIVVSVPPGGGSTEPLARIVGEEMQKTLGQPVLIEFKPGASQRLGPEFVAKSPPDGYTLLVASSGQMTIFPSSYRKLNYDPARDFVPLMHAAAFRLVLVANPVRTPMTSVREFVDYARQKGSVSIGSFSAGGASHFGQVLFARETGIQTLHVPYKGSAPMKVDLLGGQIDAAFDVDSSVAGLAKEGRLRVLAQSGTSRSPGLPDVATFREQGVKQLDMTLWLGFFAPAATPKDVVARLVRELQRAIAVPDVRARLAAAGMEPTGTTSAEFVEIIRRDTALWGQAVRESGFQADE